MPVNKDEWQHALDELSERFGDTRLDKNKKMGDNQQPGLNITETPQSFSMPTQPQSRCQDDDKEFFISQIKAMTAALSIPLSSVVTPFEGDPTKFKQWIKEVEKYALMSGKQNHEIPILAYMTCKGSVGNFIKRYFDETEIPSWNDLKTLLRDRFADVIDSQHAIAIMRRTRQFDNE
jgi:hypothetical protein